MFIYVTRAEFKWYAKKYNLFEFIDKLIIIYLKLY